VGVVGLLASRRERKEAVALLRELKKGSPSGIYFGFPGQRVMDTYMAQRTGQMGRAFADVHFVYEIVGRISAAAASLPLKVFSLGQQDQVRTEKPDHPAAVLLRRPNSETPRFSMIQGTVGDLCLHGNAFWLKVRSTSGGPPIELWRLRPERMEPVPDTDTGELLGWMYRVNYTDPKSFLAEDIVHFKTFNPNHDYVGLSPIQALRFQMELGRDAEQAAIDLWSNGAHLSGLLTNAGVLDPAAKEALAKQFRAQMTGPGNHFRVPILEEGMDYKAVQLNPKDAEFINTSKLTRERFASAYGYPLPEVYARVHPDDLRKALYSDAVLPWSTLIEETLELTFMSEWPNDVAFPQFQTRHILDADLAARYAAYKDGVYSGWLPPKHIQRIEDIPADLPTYIPMNMDQVGPDGKIIPTEQPGGTPPKDSSGGMGGADGQDTPGTSTAKRLVRPPWWQDTEDGEGLVRPKAARPRRRATHRAERKYSDDEARDDHGRWTAGGGGGAVIDQAATGLASGGFSVDVTTGAEPTSGWMVSTAGSESSISASQYTRDRLQSYYGDHLATLSQAGNYWGGWLDGGKFYLDVSTNVAEESEAVRLMGENGQQAIYNAGTGETLYADGHRTGPTKAKDGKPGLWLPKDLDKADAAIREFLVRHGHTLS
jgi:HK97 family phage portal protein